MGRLSQTLPGAPGNLRVAFAFLLLVAFGIKAAVFPLFFWLPASYHTAPPEVGAVFSGLLTKVGVYALLRLDMVLLEVAPFGFHGILAIVAGITMVGGVLGAFSQNAMRRILSFHIISQIGYLVMALSIGTTAALAALVFYLVHNVFTKTALFLASGIIIYRTGGDRLRPLGGVFRAAPGVALLFLVPALSLAGIPPLSGFWAKLFLVQEAIATSTWILLVAALATGLLTLLSMLKIWTEVYWKRSDSEEAIASWRNRKTPGETMRVTATVILVAFIILIGLLPEPLLGTAQAAAEQLVDPERYVSHLTGGGP